jgi:transposase-like protein
MDPTCTACGSTDVTPTCEPDEDGVAEFQCNDCGEYFTDFVPTPDP